MKLALAYYKYFTYTCVLQRNRGFSVKRFTVEVDEEVFACLESEARNRIETHNTVLRRRLLADPTPPNPRSGQRISVPGPGTSDRALGAHPGLPDLPFGTPSALQQILWVAHLVRSTDRSRPEATADVARAIVVTPQTVSDKYGRQLGLTADRFDVLLREPSLGQLEQLLGDRFPRHRATIQLSLAALRPEAETGYSGNGGRPNA